MSGHGPAGGHGPTAHGTADHASFQKTSIEGPTPEKVRAVMEKLEPKIADYLSRYPQKRAALLPALHLCQAEFGFLPPIVQRAVAHRLELAPGEVFRVVEFYTLFRGEPCGKHVVMVCGTLSCELAGCNRVIAALKEELGIALNETTKDGQFTLERVECLGWCDKAPVVQVNESDYHDQVTPESAKALVRKLKNV
jgi:NADH-quinone oxidoreductase subunit E